MNTPLCFMLDCMLVRFFFINREHEGKQCNLSICKIFLTGRNEITLVIFMKKNFKKKKKKTFLTVLFIANIY